MGKGKAKPRKRTPRDLAASSGQPVKGGMVTRKAGGSQQDYLKVTMTDAFVSNYQVGGSSD